MTNRQDNQKMDDDDRRAAVLARRARVQAATPQLLPEQRFHQGTVYGPLQRGHLYDLQPGDLLEVVNRRYRYDQVVKEVGREARARTRVTVVFQGTHVSGFRLNQQFDTCSYRRPV